MTLVQFNRLTKRPAGRRRRSAETAPDLVQLLTESIEAVNARAARREAGARGEQDSLIMLLTWSIRLIEVSRARNGQLAPQIAEGMEDEYVDSGIDE